MKARIEKLDHQGRGIARINDKIIFIENALPNEEVEIEIINNKKNFMEGVVVKYLTESAKRIKSDCDYFDNCGGCDLRNMTYYDTLEFKQNKVKEIIKKFLGLDIKLNEIIQTIPYNYRNKVSLKVKNKIGFYKKRTNDLIEINNCKIADENINEIINRVKKLDLKNINEIIIRCSRNLEQKMLILDITTELNENKIIDLFSDLDSIVIRKDKKYKTIYKYDFIYEQIKDLKFIISPDSFFQVNTLGCEKLYDKVLDSLDLNENDRVLDLYCGTGTIGLFISKYVKEVLGIEINKYAVEDAKKNKELNHINNIRFICNDVSKEINKLNDFNIVIVDPPRSGLDNNTISNIIKINPEKIIYVSCDPVTMARDLKLLSENYDIKEITPVDMFPYTCHVECVCVLKRK